MTTTELVKTLASAKVGDTITSEMIVAASAEHAKVQARRMKEDSKKTAEYTPLGEKMLEVLRANGTMTASKLAPAIGVSTSKVVYIAKFLGDKVKIGETITDGRVIKVYTAE